MMIRSVALFAVRTPPDGTEKTPMLIAVPAQEMRIRLGEYLDRADLSGDAFVVTRGERPKAVLIGANHYVELIERLEALESGRSVEPRAENPQGDQRVLTKDKLKAMLR